MRLGPWLYSPVEAREISAARGRTASLGPNLADADAAEAEAFLRIMLRVFPLLGISAFEKKEAKTQSQDRTMLQLTAKSIDARGYAQPGGFVVCEGSTAVVDEVESIPPSVHTARKDLLEQGVMEPTGTFYRFTRDYDLSSPSTAAGVLLGRSANGRIEWKDTAGKTLKELQEAEAEG